MAIEAKISNYLQMAGMFFVNIPLLLTMALAFLTLLVLSLSHDGRLPR